MSNQIRNYSAALSVMVSVGLGLISIQDAAAQTARRQVTIDAASVVGTIKPFTGYNGAPEQPARGVAQRQVPEAQRRATPAQQSGNSNDQLKPATPEQAALFYRQLGITMSRTHDSQGGDTMYGTEVNTNVIFPDKNADPKKPESYNFGPTDLVIKSMTENGVEPFFRVGDGHDGFIPPDFDKYAEVVKHIVMHYNKGWANGYRYNIKHWEFWNEPDFTVPGRAQFWAGTMPQYVDFYAKVRAAIKSVDSTLLVGGPSIADNDPEYQRPFLKMLKDRKIGLDFYSYHYYSVGSNDPYDWTRLGNQIQAELKEFGFGEIPIIINEFGYDLYAPFKGIQKPAFFSAGLTYLQDSAVDRAYYHGAGVGRLFSGDGITPAGYVFQTHASLQATPARLKATGADDIGFAVLAGKATEASSDTTEEVRILISNYVIPEENRGPYENGKGIQMAEPYKGDLQLQFPHSQVKLDVLPRRNPTYTNNGGYDLTINNLPAWASNGYTVSRYRMNDANPMFTAVDSVKHTERKLTISADLPAPAVELIVIRSVAAGPATREGIWNYKL